MASLSTFTIHVLSIPDRPYSQKCLESWKSLCEAAAAAPVTVREIHMPAFPLRCQALYDAIQDPIGKMNILKWEHLEKFGGMFVDPDVFLTRPLDGDLLLPCEQHSFVCYKNEVGAPGMLSSAVVKFQAGDAILRRMVDMMASYSVLRINEAPSWQTVGDGLLTRVCRETRSSSAFFRVLPSYLFAPFFAEKGLMFNGHCKVYGVQLQDHPSLSAESEKDNDEADLEILRSTDIPKLVRRFVDTPLDIENDRHAWCQLVIFGGKNPDLRLMAQCLQMVMAQHGALLFGIEVVWIDDPATSPQIRQNMETLCDRFSAESRNCIVHLYRPSFPIDGPGAVQRAMERVHALFPDRDMILQFYAAGAVKALQNQLFCVEKMQEVIGDESAEQEEGEEEWEDEQEE